MSEDRKKKSGAAVRKQKLQKELFQASTDPKQRKIDFTGSASSSTTIHNAQKAIEIDDTNTSDIATGSRSEIALAENLFPNIGNIQEAVLDDKQEECSEEITVNDFLSDKGIYDDLPNAASEINKNLEKLVAIGACQPKKTSVVETKKRKFSVNYFVVLNSLGEERKRSWLAFSAKKQYAYCHACWLFGQVEVRKSAWVTGFTDWKHIGQSIQWHSESQAHFNSVVALHAFANNRSIKHSLDKQINAEAKRWQDVLTVQFGLIRVLATLGLPFRGHSGNIDDENCGVYLSLLKFIATRDPVLAQHLSSVQKIKYLSKTISDEQISLLASETRSQIKENVKQANFFTIIADSTTDISHMDQLAILLRYVIVDNNKKTVEIAESFISFIDIHDASAQSIAETIYEELFHKHGLNPSFLRGQAYDGAANMSGIRGGVQAILKEMLGENAFAPYVHCPPHQINLVIVHAAETDAPVEVMNFFGIVQEVYNFFSDSNRRWDLFLQLSAENAKSGLVDDQLASAALNELTVEVDSEIDLTTEVEPIALSASSRTIKLKSLSTTRWAARLKATSSIIRNYAVLIKCLEKLIETKHDCNEVRRSIALQKQLKWQFLLTLIWWNRILEILDCISQLLQSKSNDLFIVLDLFKSALSQLNDLRTNECLNKFIDLAKTVWTKAGQPVEKADFATTRVHRVSRMADEHGRDERAQDPLTRYRDEVYFKTLDKLTSEMNARIGGLEETVFLFGFLHPSRLHALTRDEIIENADKIVARFSMDFTTELGHQLNNFKALYFTEERDVSTAVLGYLNFIVSTEMSDMFTDVEVLCRLFLSLPIGIASAERAMSGLRRLKTYLRNTLGQKKLSDLALLSIEKNIVSQLNLSNVIKTFAKEKARRGARFESVDA